MGGHGWKEGCILSRMMNLDSNPMKKAMDANSRAFRKTDLGHLQQGVWRKPSPQDGDELDEW
jgi:hypothetical protein